MVRRSLSASLLFLPYIALGVALSPDPLFGFDRFVLPKEALFHAVALAAAVSTLRHAREKRGFDPLDLALYAFLLGSSAAALGAQNGFVALRALSLSASGVLLFQATRFATAGGERSLLMRLVCVGGASAALPALFEAYGLAFRISTLHRAPSGTFGNRNAMAHVVAIALPCVVYLLVQAGTKRARAAYGACLSLFVWVLLLSRCRAAWLGLFVAALVALTARFGPALRTRPVLLVALSGLLGVGLAQLPNRLAWRSPAPYAESLRSFTRLGEGSQAGRLAQAESTWRMFTQAPVLGVGPGNFRVHLPRYASLDGARRGVRDQTPVRLPNDDWLGVLAERGGLAGFALLLAGLFAVRALWRAGERGDAEARATGLSLLALVSVMGSFDAVLAQAAPLWLASVALGALLPARATQTARVAPVVVATALLSAAGLGRAALRLWAGHVYSHVPVEVARYERAARIDPGSEVIHRKLAEYYTGRKECDAAAPHLRALAELYPFDARTKRLLARCQP